jgi:hypothetical protein
MQAIDEISREIVLAWKQHALLNSPDDRLSEYDQYAEIMHRGELPAMLERLIQAMERETNQ